jgi:hypothetical protein
VDPCDELHIEQLLDGGPLPGVLVEAAHQALPTITYRARIFKRLSNPGIDSKE